MKQGKKGKKMIKTHIYTKNHVHTVKDSSLQISILRSHSVKDGQYTRPKGKQLVQITITEANGRLIITNTTTGNKVNF